jgi:hypothetical protein
MTSWKNAAAAGIGGVLLVGAGATPAAAVGPASSSTTPIYISVQIGAVKVQADGRGSVNAFADRTVGGATSVILQEFDALSGAVTRQVGGDCRASGGQRCWTPTIPDNRHGTSIIRYRAVATLEWTAHGVKTGRTGPI